MNVCIQNHKFFNDKLHVNTLNKTVLNRHECTELKILSCLSNFAPRNRIKWL
jgi:hypothetical protein